MKYEVNIETPDTLEDTFKLQAFIDAPRPSKIYVSTAYQLVLASAKEGYPSLRPGFDFKFWFDELELAQEFVKLYPYAKVV